MTGGAGDTGTSLRLSLRRLVEISALATLAIGQPLLDVFGQSPETFVFLDQSDPSEVVRFALLILVVPPLALWAVGEIVGLAGARVRGVVHVATLALLAGLLAIVVVKRAAEIEGVVVLVVAAIVAVGFVTAYRRWEVVRSWLGALGLALPLVGLAFVLTSPTSDLISGNAEAEVVDVEIDSEVPVVMLVLDEFPTITLMNEQGGIDGARFPNFARLAADAHWYRNATANAGFTQLAVPAMLDGRLPSLDRDAIWTDHPRNLFNLLGGSYELNVVESLTQICAPSVCDGRPPPPPEGADETEPEPEEDEPLWSLYDQAIEVYQSQVSLDEGGFDPGVAFEEGLVAPPTTTTPTTTIAPPLRPDDERSQGETLDELGARLELRAQPTRFESFLEDLDAYPDRTMHFLHLLLPHRPWRTFADGTTFDAPDLLEIGSTDTESLRWAQPWLTAVNRQTHVLQAQYTDALLGRLLDRLQESGLYDDALIVVAGDHGASFTDGESLRIRTDVNSAEIMWVPFFVKEPHSENGEINDDNVQSYDVLPTIADVLGIDLPWPVDGVSTIDPDAARPTTKTFVERDSVIDTVPEVLELPAEFDLEALTSRAMAPLVRGRVQTIGLYRGQPFAEVVGQPTADLVAEPSTGLVVSIDRLAGFATTDPAQPLPAYVTGTVAGAAEGDVFGFSVNGRLVGLSPVFEWADRESMVATILPRRAFVDGPDELTVGRLVRRADATIGFEPATVQRS